MGDNPYAEDAPGYLAAGFSPIPLPYRDKFPPPTGFTGYLGEWVTAEHVARWSRRQRNVGLRLPETALGIDVDDYTDKAGGASLAAAEDRLGALPPTWRSTSRADDPVSGIRLFRVPAGRQWADEVGPNVEVIHWGHRYVVASPSVHPEGREYLWFDPDGLPADAPAVDELPALPDAWVEHLDRGAVSDRPPQLSLKESDAGKWLEGLPADDPCRAVTSTLFDAERMFTGDGAPHNIARTFTLRLIRLGEQGHVGVPAGLDTLEAMWLQAKKGPPGYGEWERMVTGAVAKVLADPTSPEDRGCCSRPEDDFADLHHKIFNATPVLQQIRDAAYAQLVGSEALLCYAICRVLATVPPGVTLPPVVGGNASLNLGVAVVGGSGGGKSMTLPVSRRVIGLVGEDQKEIERNIGSGEGIAETFLYDETVIGPRGGLVKTGRKLLVGDPRRILMAGEIDHLGATKDRSGATIAPTLRSALMGETLGSENASAERRRHVPEGSYRLVLLLGVQPTRSRTLLEDADAGTPQRLIWVNAVDPTLPDHDVEWPGSLDWSLPEHLPLEIDYPDHIKAEVRAARRAKVQSGDASPESLDGHLLLTRLKVAFGLALLHGEAKITDAWWEIAGYVVEMSMAVQDECKQVLMREVAAERERRAKSEGTAAVIKAEVVDAHKAGVARATRAILRKLGAAGKDGVAWTEVRNAIKYKDRVHAMTARNALEARGQVRVEDVSVGDRKGERLYPGDV